QECIVCGQTGASIRCCQVDCTHVFHLPCAEKGGCITQYYGWYRSFCWQHRPGQPVDADPEAGTICLFCLDPVESRKSFTTLVCPVCTHAWFHRACIQRHAACIGMTTFGCPLCRDRERFRTEMLRMGISIPSR
ncbi:PHF7 protein, partial [Rhinopomastus cyanomelas]|nr:PHF7 protein [Rhinopomastus cyanomelas]